MAWSVRGRILGGSKSSSSLLLKVQSGCRAKSVYYSMGTKDYFLGVHWPGPEADHSLLMPRLMSGAIPPFHP